MKELILEVYIDQIELDGRGSGDFMDLGGNQKRASIPFSMPGDLILTAVQKKKKSVFPGPLLDLIQGAEGRLKPRCPHFGLCGGCSWQHIPYEQQLEIKQDFIAHIFNDLAPQQGLKKILPSPDEWEYRNKMEFSFSQDKQGNRYLGLIMQGSRGKVFQLEECYLPSGWFAETVKKVRNWWENRAVSAYHPNSNEGTLRTLTLRKSSTRHERMVILTVSGRPEYAIRQNDLEDFKNLFSDDVSLYLKIHQTMCGQPTQFYEMHLKGSEAIHETISVSLGGQKSTVHFEIGPSSFFQPNTHQAEKLYTAALNLAALDANAIVYDLFCGTGTLGLLAARFVKQVIGIELSSEAALDGEANAKANAISNAQILDGSVEEILKKGPFIRPSVVFLDPPRAGLTPDARTEVLALQSPTIVYISCNPRTQAEDVKVFIQNGYQLEQIQPVDQFPHTPHIENIILLKKHEIFTH